MGKPRMNSWSLVTVTFKSRPDLERFWAGGVASGIEWIVVDNASTDGSAELAESLGATVVRLSKNVGFGAANNVGIELASAQYRRVSESRCPRRRGRIVDPPGSDR